MIGRTLVYIVDDESAVREALACLLQAAGLMTKCYSSGEEFLQSFDPHLPSCLVIDVCMPGMDGLTLQSRLAKNGCRLPVVILTGHADVPMAVEAMRRGAVTLLQKPPRFHELLDLVKGAIEWHRECLLQQQAFEDVNQRLTTLTDREKEVLALVVVGRSSKEIASELGIGQRTVEQHRAHLLSKLKVNSLAELVQISLRDRPRASLDLYNCSVSSINGVQHYSAL